MNALLDKINFNADGLVTAIAQQHDTGEVLMLAWMNSESILETLRTGQVCYFSRSRQKLWRKGESSGQVQKLVEMRLDCDGDALAAAGRAATASPAIPAGGTASTAPGAKAPWWKFAAPLVAPEELYKGG